MKKRAVINLKDLNISGNIIDVAAKGNTIGTEIAATVLMEDENILDKDFISWNKKCIPSEERVYDNAIAFFSLNTLGNRFKVSGILKELKRVLKKDGRILVWDSYGTGIRPCVTYDLKVLISEGDIRRIRCKVKFNPFRVRFNGLLKLLAKNGFTIQNSRVVDNVFHIEAINTVERK